MTSFKWFLTFFLVFAVTSFICGIAEESLGGSGLASNPMRDIFDVFGIGSSESVGITAFLNPANWGGLLSGLWRMFTWQYSILMVDTFTEVVRYFLFVISAAFVFTFIVWLVSIVNPFAGGGSA